MDLHRRISNSNRLIAIQEVEFEEPVKDMEVTKRSSKCLEEMIEDEAKKRNSINNHYIDQHSEHGISPLGSSDSIFDDINCTNCIDLIKEIQEYAGSDDIKCSFCHTKFLDFDLFCYKNCVLFMFDKQIQHGYHLRCLDCNKELEQQVDTNSDFKIPAKFYCIKCHDSLNVPICNDCLELKNHKEQMLASVRK